MARAQERPAERCAMSVCSIDVVTDTVSKYRFERI